MDLILALLRNRLVLFFVGALALAAAVNLEFKLLAEVGRHAATRQQAEAVEKDRGKIIAWADMVCSITGKVYRPVGSKRSTWGVACEEEVRSLAAFKADATSQSAKNETEHLRTQLAKTAADAASARRSAAAANSAMRRMEKANATVQDDHVGGDWFGAANELGGLRPPVEP